MEEADLSPGSGTFGTSILSRVINCIKLPIRLCCKQRYGCGYTVSAPTWSVTMVSVWWHMLVGI